MGSLDCQTRHFLIGASRLKLFFRVRDYKASHLMTYSYWSFGLEAKQGGELDAFEGTYDL